MRSSHPSHRGGNVGSAVGCVESHHMSEASLLSLVRTLYYTMLVRVTSTR